MISTSQAPLLHARGAGCGAPGTRAGRSREWRDAPGTGLLEGWARAPRRCGGTGGRRGQRPGRGADCSTAREGAERSDRPGNPRKRQQWCLLTPERRREGVPGPQAPNPEPPGRLSAPRGLVTFRTGENSVILTDREAPGTPSPSVDDPSRPWPLPLAEACVKTCARPPFVYAALT